MPTTLITGANRGLGLGLVQGYLALQYNVIAICRNLTDATELQQLKQAHENLQLLQADLKDLNQIEALSQQAQNQPIDIIINNAGYFGPSGMNFGAVHSQQEWEDVFKINTMAPLFIAQTFIENLKQGEAKIIANISSTMGSIAENELGGRYIYRTSKTALNMVVKSMSIELAEAGIICVALNPGWVQTEMGGSGATMPAEESANKLIDIINKLKPKDNGRFYSHDGREIPW